MLAFYFENLSDFRSPRLAGFIKNTNFVSNVCNS
jgi:hypothetical protein